MRTACEGAKNHVLRGIRHPYDPSRLVRQFPTTGPDAIQLLQRMLEFDPVYFKCLSVHIMRLGQAH